MSSSTTRRRLCSLGSRVNARMSWGVGIRPVRSSVTRRRNVASSILGAGSTPASRHEAESSASSAGSSTSGLSLPTLSDPGGGASPEPGVTRGSAREQPSASAPRRSAVGQETKRCMVKRGGGEADMFNMPLVRELRSQVHRGFTRSGCARACPRSPSRRTICLWQRLNGARRRDDGGIDLGYISWCSVPRSLLQIGRFDRLSAAAKTMRRCWSGGPLSSVLVEPTRLSAAAWRR